MPYKHIHNPIKGLIKSSQPTQIAGEASANNSGIFLRDGAINADTGYVQFPTAGTTKTNKLNGVVQIVEQFNKFSGLSHLIAMTTTGAYEYNTTTETWDNITRGQELDDAESAWAAETNVTATADTTIKLRGSKSAKLVIDAAFSTGLAASFDLTAGATDVSAETAVHFWIYSTVATSAADLSLRISEQLAGGTGATSEDLDIPALVANTWTAVVVDYATPGALDAVLSIGLVVNTDLGAQTVYIDDVRSVKRYSGDSDNRWSTDVFTDNYLATNGVDQPQKYDGTLATGFQDWTTTLAAGSITTSEFVLVAKDHVILFNNTENAADAPQRASWGNIGELEDFTGGTAGFQDLVNDSSWIIAAVQLSDNQWAIYKETEIVIMDWVGGHTPFRFTPKIRGRTIAGKDAVFNVNGIHFVIGIEGLYAYGGALNVEEIDVAIHRHILDTVNFNTIARATVRWVPEENEVQFWLPTTADNPDLFFCFDIDDKNWFVRDHSLTAWGAYKSASALTIGDLVGNIGDQNFTFGSTVTRTNSPITLVGDEDGNIFQLSQTTFNDDGVAVVNSFETPDFIDPENTGDINAFFRVKQLLVDAKGQKVETHWSDDGGNTWNPTEVDGNHAITLTNIYAVYQRDMDITVQKIRFRFLNIDLSSGFNLRYYGFLHFPRSTRR